MALDALALAHRPFVPSSPSHSRSARIASSPPSTFRAGSVSSIRSSMKSPSRRLMTALSALPTCSDPVGLGAKRTRRMTPTVSRLLDPAPGYSPGHDRPFVYARRRWPRGSTRRCCMRTTWRRCATSTATSSASALSATPASWRQRSGSTTAACCSSSRRSSSKPGRGRSVARRDRRRPHRVLGGRARRLATAASSGGRRHRAGDRLGRRPLDLLPRSSGNSVELGRGRHLAPVKAALLTWFAQHGRDLPWRRTNDPYAVLVSEVMLQQTQVERVVPRYERWPRSLADHCFARRRTSRRRDRRGGGARLQPARAQPPRAARFVSEHGWPEDLTSFPESVVTRPTRFAPSRSASRCCRSTRTSCAFANGRATSSTPSAGRR